MRTSNEINLNPKMSNNHFTCSYVYYFNLLSYYITITHHTWMDMARITHISQRSYHPDIGVGALNKTRSLRQDCCSTQGENQIRSLLHAKAVPARSLCHLPAKVLFHFL